MIFGFYRGHVARGPVGSAIKRLLMKQFSHIMKCERLRLRKNPKETEEGYRGQILPVMPKRAEKEGHIGRILPVIPKEKEKEGYRGRILPVIPKEKEKEGHRGRILPVIPKEKEKEGHIGRILPVMPKQAEKEETRKRFSISNINSIFGLLNP